MNAELAVVAILRANPDVSALVGDRIYPLFIPLGSAYPCLTYERVSGSHASSGEMAVQDPDAGDIRIQVTAWADQYLQGKALTEAVRAALRRWRGTVDGIVVWDIQLAGDGPDLSDSDLKLFGSSVDYMVSLPK